MSASFTEVWPSVCDALGRCALRDRPGHFNAYDLDLYVGPSLEGQVVLFVAKTGLRYTPRMFELVKQYARRHFPGAIAFGRKCALPEMPHGQTREVDFVLQLNISAAESNADDFVQLYHRLWGLLAALGDRPGQSIERLAKRVIPHLTPQFGGDQKQARGKMSLEFAPQLDGEILILTHGVREHSLRANFRLPIGSKTVGFRSRSLPAPAWSEAQLGDALCDDFFRFDAKSDLSVLRSWIPLVHVLAMHDFDFKIESDQGRTLVVNAEKLHAWACGPLLRVIGEMWSDLSAGALNLEHQLRPPAPFSSLRYRVK